MLRDSATAGVKAFGDRGINNASCINHLFHLLVSSFLVIKKKRSDDDANTEEEVLDQRDHAFKDIGEAWDGDECVEEIRAIVNDFRKAVLFLKRSTKCKELLDKIQTLQQIDRVLSVHLYLRT